MYAESYLFLLFEVHSTSIYICVNIHLLHAYHLSIYTYLRLAAGSGQLKDDQENAMSGTLDAHDSCGLSFLSDTSVCSVVGCPRTDGVWLSQGCEQSCGLTTPVTSASSQGDLTGWGGCELVRLPNATDPPIVFLHRLCWPGAAGGWAGRPQKVGGTAGGIGGPAG